MHLNSAFEPSRWPKVGHFESRFWAKFLGFTSIRLHENSTSVSGIPRCHLPLATHESRQLLGRFCQSDSSGDNLRNRHTRWMPATWAEWQVYTERNVPKRRQKMYIFGTKSVKPLPQSAQPLPAHEEYKTLCGFGKLSQELFTIVEAAN